MAVSGKVARGEFDCPLFCCPKEIPVRKLPTCEDILECCFHEQCTVALKANGPIGFAQFSSIVAPRVEAIFDGASIRTVTPYRIVQLINAYYNSYRNLMKSFKRDREKEQFKGKVEEFKKKALLLFDMSACKCKITLTCHCLKSVEACECPVLISCNCEKEKKIPAIELKFLYCK